MYLLILYRGNKFGIEQQVGMTTDAVVMHHIPACLMNKNHLRFHPQGKYGSMPHAILSLEKVLTKDIVMRNMTVITIGNPAM
jgi:hypothetical protein